MIEECLEKNTEKNEQVALRLIAHGKVRTSFLTILNCFDKMYISAQRYFFIKKQSAADFWQAAKSWCLHFEPTRHLTIDNKSRHEK